jgi:hypothetical protein
LIEYIKKEKINNLQRLEHKPSPGERVGTDIGKYTGFI